MSVVVIPNVGKIHLQKLISGESADSPDEIKLAVNDFLASPATVLGSFTEATFAGYAAGTLAGASTDAVVNVDGRAVTTWTQVTFTGSGVSAEVAYGYYVLSAAGVLCWFEKFDSTVPFAAAGAFCKITPKLTYQSLFSNV